MGMPAVHEARGWLRAAISEIWMSRIWVWALPLVVYYMVTNQSTALIERGIAAAIGIGLLTLVIRNPVRGLLVLVAALPMHVAVLSLLYKLGAPFAVVKNLAYWKELVVAGLVVAAVRRARDERHRFDALDWAAIFYLLFVCLYFVLPRLWVPATHQYPLGAPTDFEVKLQGFRTDAVFVILLLAVRHLRLAPEALERLKRTIIVTGVVVAAIAIFEFFFTGTFDRITIDHIGLLDYRFDVLGTWTPNNELHLYGYVGGREFLRVGSILFNALSLGFYLVLPFALAVERVCRSARMTSILALGTIGTALILTQTRSALLGGVVALVLATRPRPGRSPQNRTRFALIAAMLIAVAIPFAATTGLTDRVGAAAGGTDSSASSHWESTYWGFRILIGQPFGRGLGTSPSVGGRYFIDGQYTSENYYLQVGNELGIVTMGGFVVLTLLVVRAAGRAANKVEGSEVPAAVYGAIVGLSIGAILLHVWNDFATAWTVWALIGASVGAAELQRGEPRRAPEVPAGQFRPSTTMPGWRQEGLD